MYRWLLFFVLAGGLWFFFESREQTLLEDAAPSPEPVAKEEKEKAPLVRQATVVSSTSANSSPTTILTSESPPASKSFEVPEQEFVLPAVLRLDKEGLVTDEGGAPLNIYRMSQADEVCKKMGMALPSIRELVEWNGHISSENEEAPHGYNREQVIAKNADGKMDEFYYIYNSSGGPLGPKNNKTDYVLWSSSTDSQFSNNRFCYNAHAGYVCAGESMDPEKKSMDGVVRCVAKKK